jgi:hypothetical protein
MDWCESAAGAGDASRASLSELRWVVKIPALSIPALIPSV